MDALCDQSFAQRRGADRLATDAQTFQQSLRVDDDGRMALGPLTNSTRSPGSFRLAPGVEKLLERRRL